MKCEICIYQTEKGCSLDSPIDGSAACFAYDHLEPTTEAHNEVFTLLLEGFKRNENKPAVHEGNFTPDFVHYIINQYLIK